MWTMGLPWWYPSVPPVSAVPWDHTVILSRQGRCCQPRWGREGSVSSLVVIAWLLLWVQGGWCKAVGKVTEPCESETYSLLSSLKLPQITLRVEL